MIDTPMLLVVSIDNRHANSANSKLRIKKKISTEHHDHMPSKPLESAKLQYDILTFIIIILTMFIYIRNNHIFKQNHF